MDGRDEEGFYLRGGNLLRQGFGGQERGIMKNLKFQILQLEDTTRKQL